jgi:hypothetical protein
VLNLNIKVVIIGILLAWVISQTEPVRAQESGKTRGKDPGSFQLKETEITGQLKDVLGSLKLLETEIVGTVARPRLSYSLPWKDPDPGLLNEAEPQGGNQEEIYTPLDKDRFSHEILTDRAHQTP